MSVIVGTAGNDTLLAAAAGSVVGGRGGGDWLFGGAGPDTLRGGAGADLLTDWPAGPAPDQVRGGAGDDTIVAYLGADTLDGGAGIDIARLDLIGPTAHRFAAGQTRLADGRVLRGIERFDVDGSAFGDTLRGGALGDTLVGGDGLDRLNGGAGDDFLIGETVFGGAGNDTVVGVAGGILEGGDGLDLVRVSWSASTVAVVFGTAAPAVLPGGGRLVGFERFDLDGSDAEGDVLVGGAFDDDLAGLGGDDTLAGGRGDDTLRGGLGADRLALGAGDDRGDGSEGDDTMTGGAGNDTLHGGAGNDRDVLAGGAGDDWLLDGATMRGGAGDDVVVASFRVGAAALRLDGGSGMDTLVLGFGNAGPIRFAPDALPNGVEATGFERFDVLGSAAGDLLEGGAFDDTLAGSGGSDTLIGGRGADRINTGLSSADRNVILYRAADEGGDLIEAYDKLADQVAVSAAGFGGGLVAGAPVDAARFVVNDTGLSDAPAGLGQFVYEADASRLWWDVDGAGAALGVVLFTLDRPRNFTASEIDVIG